MYYHSDSYLQYCSELVRVTVIHAHTCQSARHHTSSS